MASEGILRFITVRPAKARVNPPPTSTLVKTAGLFRQLASAVAEGADRERLRDLARYYTEPADYPESVDPAALREWFFANQDEPVETADLDGLVRHAYGVSLGELVGSDRFTAARARLTDQVLSTVLLGDATGEGEQHLLDSKLLALAITLSTTATSPTTHAASEGAASRRYTSSSAVVTGEAWGRGAVTGDASRSGQGSEDTAPREDASGRDAAAGDASRRGTGSESAASREDASGRDGAPEDASGRDAAAGDTSRRGTGSESAASREDASGHGARPDDPGPGTSGGDDSRSDAGLEADSGRAAGPDDDPGHGTGRDDGSRTDAGLEDDSGREAGPDDRSGRAAGSDDAAPREDASGRDGAADDASRLGTGSESAASREDASGHGARPDAPGHGTGRDPGSRSSAGREDDSGRGASPDDHTGHGTGPDNDSGRAAGSDDGSGSGERRVTVGELVAGRAVVLPGFLARVRAEPPPSPPSVPGEDDHARAEARAWMEQLDVARRELVRLVVDGRHIEQPSALAPVNPDDDGDPARRLGELRAADAGRPRLSADGVDGLSEETRVVLDRLGQLDGPVLPFRAVPVIEEEMQAFGTRIAPPAVHSGLLAFDGGEIDLDRYHRALSKAAPVADPLPVPQHSQAGVADLLVVRQKIKAYELGEFAHIENVMSGETRERTTRRLTQVEEITEQETETETEKEKDLQSTTRNELQNEAEKHVKSQLDIEAGLQLSGSYGPAVSFTSSLKAGYSTTTEESQRKASSFSQEVTQRTVEKVRERVRTLVRRRTLEEFEENNRHGFANDRLSHVRGIYRWLNKVYDAQVFNYGQRMMFDFVVPEPAAFFLYGLVENPPQDSELVKPPPPTVDGFPLHPGLIGPASYGPLLARYRVADAPAMPAELQTVSCFFHKEGGGELSNSSKAGKVEIPAGYRAYRASVQATHLFEPGKPHAFQIVFDGTMHDFTEIWGSQPGSTSWLEKEASVSISVVANAWAVAIDVDCKRSPEAYQAWQHAAFDAIIAAYQQQLAEYNERKAQRELERSSQQFGRNPLVNRRLERDELKKWVVMMLARKPDLNLDSFQSPTPGNEPVLNLDKANANGRFIRFLENAFEWQNMLYVFYPHLWGRRARWISALNVTDPDPDFAAFLRAGAARVQVPVRPGFESAVAYFVHTGNVWDGNDVPRVEDELYVPIIDEITTNLGKIDGGVPYPAKSKPWEVIVPTDLVLVQDLDEVPPLRDALRPGETVTITDHEKS